MASDDSDVNRMIAAGLWEPGAPVAKGKSPGPSSAGPIQPVAHEAPVAPAAARTPMPQVMTAPASPLAGAGPSVISLNVEITGSIITPDELHIYGTVEGNVRASSLVICKGGMVRGEVIAETILVHGSVEGSIQSKKVQLLAGASVRGDIIHGALGIDPAAMFEGASMRIPAPAAERPVLSVV